MVSQPRRHGGRTGPPRPGRTAAVGGLGLGQRQAYARMGQAEIVVAMVEGQLLPQPVFTLAQRADPSPDRGDMLADTEVDPVTVDGGIAPPTSASKPCVPLLRHTAPQ
jgi:hypothetical protein